MHFINDWKTCKCGLQYQDVNFIHSRIRGYCCKTCRTELLTKKRGVRLKEAFSRRCIELNELINSIYAKP
jgi:hypothetical protein